MNKVSRNAHYMNLSFEIYFIVLSLQLFSLLINAELNEDFVLILTCLTDVVNEFL